MPVITETFTASQVKRYTFRGGFFRLLECSGDLEVSVTVYDSESGASENLNLVKAGLAITMPFDFIEIQAVGGAQTVKFMVASHRVEYDREVKQFELIGGGSQVGSALGSGTLFSSPCRGKSIECKYSVSFRPNNVNSFLALRYSAVDKVLLKGTIGETASEGGTFVITPPAGAFSITYEVWLHDPAFIASCHVMTRELI